MEVQELSQKMDGLHHYLIDVWDWDALDLICKEYVEIVDKIDNQQRDELTGKRIISGRVNEHLRVKFAEAVVEVDRVTDLLRDVPDYLLDVWLEKVQIDLRLLGKGMTCEKHWIEHRPFEPWDGWSPDLTDKEIEEYENRGQEWEWWDQFPNHYEPWQFIAMELAPLLRSWRNGLGSIGGHVPERETERELLRIDWTPSTAVTVHLAKELLSKGYIFFPGMNGKDGEGNITELFRRLSQAFIFRGRKKQELSPEELQRRYNGRPLSKAKAAKVRATEAKGRKANAAGGKELK